MAVLHDFYDTHFFKSQDDIGDNNKHYIVLKVVY